MMVVSSSSSSRADGAATCVCVWSRQERERGKRVSRERVEVSEKEMGSRGRGETHVVGSLYFKKLWSCFNYENPRSGFFVF